MHPANLTGGPGFLRGGCSHYTSFGSMGYVDPLDLDPPVHFEDSVAVQLWVGPRTNLATSDQASAE